MWCRGWGEGLLRFNGWGDEAVRASPLDVVSCIWAGWESDRHTISCAGIIVQSNMDHKLEITAQCLDGSQPQGLDG